MSGSWNGGGLGSDGIGAPTGIPAQGTAAWGASVKTTAMRYSLATAMRIREIAERAYEKALGSAKSYDAEGLRLQRYDLLELRTEFEYWCDVVNEIEKYGSTQHPLIYKRVIPVDL